VALEFCPQISELNQAHILVQEIKGIILIYK
jgi:hypothetical protein